MKKVENLLGLVLGMKHYIDASLNEIVRIYNDTIQHIDHESAEVDQIRKDYLFRQDWVGGSMLHVLVVCYTLEMSLKALHMIDVRTNNVNFKEYRHQIHDIFIELSDNIQEKVRNEFSDIMGNDLMIENVIPQTANEWTNTVRYYIYEKDVNIEDELPVSSLDELSHLIESCYSAAVSLMKQDGHFHFQE